MENIIGTIVFMDFDKKIEIKVFAFAYTLCNFKGSQPESYQVNIFPTHGDGHYS